MTRQYIPPGGVDRIPPYDSRSGEHLWITVALYRVDPQQMTDPTEGPVLLDQENLISLGMFGCYHCERPYEPRMLTRRCPGEPR